MANYMATTRTNYFRVTDEEKYDQLIEGLTPKNNIRDFTKKDEDGTIWHGFGCMGSIDYCPQDNDECDFDAFIRELQKILPENEAFILMESGYENLCYVVGFVAVVTKDKSKTIDMHTLALECAKEMLGNSDFRSRLDY